MNRFSRHGLTLLEVLVALTIAGLAAAAGYAAFGMLVDARGRAEARADDASRAAAVRTTLGAWLADARLAVDDSGEIDVPFRGADGLARTAAGALPDDELTWLTSASTPVSDQGGGTVVRLRVVRADSGAARGLVADLAEWHGPRRATLVLAPAAAGFDVRYLTATLGARRWVPSWTSGTLLPIGAQLVLTAYPGDTLPALLREPITVALGGGR